jgi:hypothetical protein
VDWLRKLFGRERVPPPPPPERTDRINPLPAETAVQWSAEDQETTGVEESGEWMERGEPDPRSRDKPNP